MTPEIISQFDHLSWREPLWLLLAFIPLLLWLFRGFMQRTQVVYAEAHLLPWVVVRHDKKLPQRLLSRLFSKASAYLIAWVLLSLVAVGPRLPVELGGAQQATDMDIMLVVDVSRSMQAADIYPSRIRRVQIEIEELLERSSGKRLGVVVFAARAHLLVPLTSDFDALRFYLRSLDSMLLPTRGSVPTAALALARNELQMSTDPAAIVLFSDGDFPSVETESTNRTEKNNNIPVYVLGLGSASGEAIPLEDGTWLEYENRAVISVLNEANLRKLTNPIIGKHYSPALDDDSDWRLLYGNGIAIHGKNSLPSESEQQMLWRELYHWPLFLAILLLWFSMLPYPVSYVFSFAASFAALFVKVRRLVRRNETKLIVRTVLVSTIIVLSLVSQHDVLAEETNRIDGDVPITISQAYEIYSGGDYTKALTIYKQLIGYAARYGEASSAYKLQDYATAIRQFSLAVLRAGDDPQRASALLSLGNSYFKTGNYAAAISVYNDVLLYRPSDKKAQYNLEFSKALKKTVDERIRFDPELARAGNGPQSRIAAGTIAGGSLSIDASDDPELKQRFVADNAILTSVDLEVLINNGLTHVKLAAAVLMRQQSENPVGVYASNKLEVTNARLRMTEIEQQQGLLWKRLFEMEEGFPAPLNEPRQVTGVRPW